jgi:hypothetical protein
LLAFDMDQRARIVELVISILMEARDDGER